MASFFGSQLLMAQMPTISSFTPTSSASGFFITINGTNFTGTTAVSFGGVPASFFTVNSAVQIRAVVSSGGASGNVAVTNASGTATRPGFTFLPPPAVSSFLPTSGNYGTVVNIKGQRFSNVSNVLFGGTAAFNFTILSDTAISATVGNGASGSVTVVSNTGAGSLAGFTYTGPTINSFSPTAGPTGTMVTINGTNFTNASAVRFGDIPAAFFTVVSPNVITAVTANGSAGNVSVTTPNGTANKPLFNLAYIQSVTPFSGTLGTAVTLKGYNFLGATGVDFANANAASFTVQSDTVITAVVGYGGTGNVGVSNSYGKGYGATFFYTYPTPTFTSFSPMAGNSDTVLTLRGTGLASTSSIKIGNSYNPNYDFTVVSDSVVTVRVALGASGNITVYTAGGQATLPGFVFTGPRVTSFYPGSGTTGTKVSFYGTDLGTVTGITFGGVPATSFTIDSATGISAIVGTSATGEIKLTATNGNATLFSFMRVPQITSFSPTSGPVGTVVTITGTDFDSLYTAPTRQVFFGAVKANILSASPTQLVVTVPPGATYERIRVLNNWHVGYAPMPFTVTFGHPNQVFSSSSFAPKTDYALPGSTGGAYGAIGAAISDLDGDGKPDFVVTKNISSNNSGFTIFRNTGTDTALSFDGGTNGGSFLPNAYKVVAGDLDGDGKPELIVSYINTNGYVALYRNNSTPGNIAFANKVDIAVGPSPGDIEVGDLDGDGKNDLVVANSNASQIVSVLHNRSSLGNLIFDPRVDYATDGLVASVAIGDVTGDGKPDIVAGSHVSSIYKIAVFKNTGVVGYPAFAPRIDFVQTGLPSDLALADMDGDGKNDLVATSHTANTLFVFKNNGTGGNVGFAPALSFATGNGPHGFAVADISGDGKPDVAVANTNSNTVSVYKNITAGATIDLASAVSYTSGNQPQMLVAGDLNGDGQPELLTPNWVSYNASVFLNNLGQPTTVTLCPSVASTTLAAYATGSSYQWQVDINDGNGFVNLSDNSNYAGTATGSLQLVSIPSAWYGYRYRCLVNGNVGDLFQVKFANTWTGSVNQAWENPGNWSCGRVPDGNTDVVINSGNVSITANTTIRSLQLGATANVSVATGVVLTILH